MYLKSFVFSEKKRRFVATNMAELQDIIIS